MGNSLALILGSRYCLVSKPEEIIRLDTSLTEISWLPIEALYSSSYMAISETWVVKTFQSEAY